MATGAGTEQTQVIEEIEPFEAAQEIDIVAQLREIAHEHGALVAVNDRADVAFAARADVLHLGQDDLPVSVARQIVGPDVVIGRSTHDGAQARAAAAEEGVDYFCTGPCWPTPTKPGRTAPGLPLVRETAAAAYTGPSSAIATRGGTDAVPRGRPAKKEAKSEAYAEAEKSCMGGS